MSPPWTSLLHPKHTVTLSYLKWKYVHENKPSPRTILPMLFEDLLFTFFVFFFVFFFSLRNAQVSSDSSLTQVKVDDPSLLQGRTG